MKLSKMDRDFVDTLFRYVVLEFRHNREVANSHMSGIFIWDMAYFHCDSLNYELHFINENMLYPV